jgi:hypothetical protein
VLKCTSDDACMTMTTAERRDATNLLQRVLTAHGGLARWRDVAEDGLIARHDPAAHALGSAPSAQYLGSYRDVAGLQFPTTRTVLPRGEDNRPTHAPPMVAITFREYALAAR